MRKRDGREVPFDRAKIQSAVERAQASVGSLDKHAAAEVADLVEMALVRRYALERTQSALPLEAVPGIEEIQDLVEQNRGYLAERWNEFFGQ